MDVVWELCVALLNLQEAVVLVSEPKARREGGRRAYGPVFFAWGPKSVEDSFYLVHVRVSRKIGCSQHEFGEDATNRPYVDRCAVVSGSEEEFRRSVPAVVRVMGIL